MHQLAKLSAGSLHLDILSEDILDAAQNPPVMVLVVSGIVTLC